MATESVLIEQFLFVVWRNAVYFASPRWNTLSTSHFSLNYARPSQQRRRMQGGIEAQGWVLVKQSRDGQTNATDVIVLVGPHLSKYHEDPHIFLGSHAVGNLTRKRSAQMHPPLHMVADNTTTLMHPYRS